jgi:hypothetical protein
MILKPKTGKVLIITGNTAQCITHAAEVAIPIKSQLILNALMCFQKNKIINLQH